MDTRPAAVEAALVRARAPIADDGDGWETTAAILAAEVVRLQHVANDDR